LVLTADSQNAAMPAWSSADFLNFRGGSAFGLRKQVNDMAEADRRYPDLTQGVRLDEIPSHAPLVGVVGEQKVFLCRDDAGLRAFVAMCPHLGGPLEEGVIRDGKAICPWHHACFDLATGEAISSPAFDALERREVRVENGVAFVDAAAAPQPETARPRRHGAEARPMTIVGGGAAGFAAANALRTRGWEGEIVVISADRDPPYDRTTLTKDLLEGGTDTDHPPIAGHDLNDLDVTLSLDTAVDGIDPGGRLLRLADGRLQPYERLLLATGAEPRKADFPGGERPSVRYLRSLADGQRLLRDIAGVRKVLVVGASFIGMEAAASLRARGLEVTVVAPEARPMSRQFGDELSDLIVSVHREKGVDLRLGRKIGRLDEKTAMLDDGTQIAADLVLVGVGVEPRLGLAKAAGLRVDGGVVVDRSMRTSDPNIWAAGDIAKWRDARLGREIRVEHWVVAQRQAECAAAGMLGIGATFEHAPFFWTKHFDLAVHYVGHADTWDEISIDGAVAERNATVRFRKSGRDLAVATVGRDIESIEAELAMDSSSK
jgi:NADPH-dependent 2,4-dienoyl-CoA reductase/sulfur reductase-like enzyme/nitrite reductase/ring-hydroxylating ferredoxin subunit